MNREEYGRMFEAEERQWWYVGMRALSFALLQTAAAADAGPILDAGCGSGGNLVELGRRAPAFGVDLSADALAFARLRGIRAARASALALPFGDARFALVTSFDVLYHRWIVDDAAAVRELARVLRPGGLLLVRVPALKLLWGAHDEAVHSRHRYTRGELTRLLEGAGLTLVRASYGNTLLLPLLLLRRRLDRLTGRRGSDVGFLPAPFEWLFKNTLLFEAALVRRRLALPIGSSVFALARKPD